MAKFQKRHYELVAQTLKSCLDSANEVHEVENMTEAFITMFKADNSRFKAEMFRIASGIELK